MSEGARVEMDRKEFLEMTKEITEIRKCMEFISERIKEDRAKSESIQKEMNYLHVSLGRLEAKGHALAGILGAMAGLISSKLSMFFK